MEKMKKLISRTYFGIPVIGLIGGVIGALLGYLYYIKIGCASGSCAITSNPWMSTLWGAAMGYLFFDMFRGKKARQENPEVENTKS